MPDSRSQACFSDLVARDLVEVTDDFQRVQAGGRWAISCSFDGELTAARFATWRERDPHTDSCGDPESWKPVELESWVSSLSEQQFKAGVSAIREQIGAGDVYQVNLCRVLSTQLDIDVDLAGLYEFIRLNQRAPYASRISLVPADSGLDYEIVCASPELFLQRQNGRLISKPIKGTAPTSDQFLDKDVAENVMIVDLVRNDLGRICQTGTVKATKICERENHPGLVHLVSTVEGVLMPEASWQQIFEATFPPGSVVGAPKIAALRSISGLEPTSRGPYCGAIGWVDSDANTAELAVAIRTFWRQGRQVMFGTGGGITWDSDPDGEWDETQLKAAKLLQLAASSREI